MDAPRVAVGSTNPVKEAAVHTGLSRLEPSTSTHDVESGVSEQPRSVAATVAGAETRAERALAAARAEGIDADYGAGLEGGVARLEGTPGLHLIMWAAIVDGERTGRASGPSLRLPDPVADRLEAGEELGPVMDDRLGREGVAESEGAVGVLTGGLLTREAALAAAVSCAFAPFSDGGQSEP
ncbi:DUF84 family protein [Saliphagus infecundisoli]|uniref:inosine/xanthosine triphosphatase n=1 Tax=Saliphagus infecundisoli TaxID=1849069 RepID=A0ABD5QD21_9EURY|nr:inosine/xanthosine triphosphatase [Saliphagus infecundisoli]